MSRVIKFRGWCTRKKCMYSPEEMGIDQLTILPDGRGFINVHGSKTEMSHILDYIVPEQFAGLTDRAGTDIYEGDIVMLHSDNPDIEPEKSDVRFEGGAFRAGARDFPLYWWAQSDKGCYCYVLGNIHEHAHLPEGPK